MTGTVFDERTEIANRDSGQVTMRRQVAIDARFLCMIVACEDSMNAMDSIDAIEIANRRRARAFNRESPGTR